jgi:ubiquinone/menaquinone biosynthesis C-methylase UbiE
MLAIAGVDQRTRDDRHFDRWARRYDRSWMQPVLFGPVQRSVVAALAPRLSPSATVLDIGCGTGRLLDRIGTVLPASHLVGLDRSTGMVTAAQHLRPQLRIERASAEALPHPGACFDAVVTTISFHHWSNKPAALAEVFRVLRPGGLFALTDMSVDDLPAWPGSLWAVARRHMEDMPALEERQRLLENAGLQVVTVGPMLHRRWIKLTLAMRPTA